MKRDTKLSHLGRPSPDTGGTSVNTPVVRASTVLFSSMDAYEQAGKEKYTSFRYGIHGTPTTMALQDTLAELEGGDRAIVLPSGLAAISSVLLAYAKPKTHLLMSDSVYGPARTLCEDYLRGIGVEIEYYHPRTDAGIARLLKPETCAVYCESPGTATFEMQDIPAIAKAAHAKGIPVLHDNTWASPIGYPSFERGVDVSIHASTKYVVGHSDAMMGHVVCTEEAWQLIRPMVALMGHSTSPDDCYMALRGLRTMAIRLERHHASALTIAEWLKNREEVARVMCPALPGDEGHEIWSRDYTGGCGLFGFVLKTEDRADAVRFADSLKYFGIGSSWGGFESLVTLPQPTRTVSDVKAEFGPGCMVRLHIGLEDVDDLIADLDNAFAVMSAGG